MIISVTSDKSTRTAWQVTRDVWRALFLREISARISADRFGWTWLFIEPILHIVILIAIRELLGRTRFIINAEFIPWLVIGLMSFFVFQKSLTRAMGAINANKGLFTYRQIHPVDTVLSRCLVELLLKSVVFAIFIVALSVLDAKIIPHDVIAVILLWLGCWGLGLGCGLVISVVVAILPEMEKVVNIAMTPMYFLSGVMLPLNLLPRNLHDVLLLNPVAHYLELIRLGFFGNYHTLFSINVLYPLVFTFSSILLGLTLHVVFKMRVKAQ
ncbi:ABC transporter permease [Rheinheimera baltica]|uniref:Transport permease protein n=1 Tax=Rheinheimera baltica TaxID=67576 RepID=A0ABT9HV09_9GAMM|nr:ABC transporter permease [Rheinheimera baltica]MDP5134953.1 ABC transporter permease [Rheinheimera baltica]MDP5149796.1 ABC transporter permease [Rheinheimera baltica]